nr:hypothetical protein [Tanacetum cinerariifolium]
MTMMKRKSLLRMMKRIKRLVKAAMKLDRVKVKVKRKREVLTRFLEHLKIVRRKAMMRRSRNQDLVKRQEYKKKKTQMNCIVTDVGVESIFTTTSSLIVSLQTPTPIMTPSTIATITTSSEVPVPPPTIPSIILENLPTFNLAFRFEERLRSLETSFSEYRQTNIFVDAVSAIPGIALVEAYEADKAILDTYGDSTILKRRREDDDQEGPSAGSNRGKSAFAKEPVQTTCQMEETPFETGADDQPIVQTSQHLEWFSQPRRPPSPDRAWNTTLPAAQGDAQSWISDLVSQTDARSSFNELLDTLIDFSNFIMHRLNVDTLTPDLLAGLTYELMRGSCTSLTELEYHLKEVYKATTDQLDWVNPEGQQYPHNLLQPLPLILDNRGRRIQQPIDYNKHALWGVSHWGRKRKQFYGYAVNWESARDVYSKRRIIVVTELQIMEWYDYKHLDWISVCRDDDQIYKFKEGDFKRIRLQDIEDMLLLLVQGNLSNLTVEERLAFNVSLRMFTRSIVIKRRVEDLQLGVESYQKKLNLTKPATYRPDLRRREAYTTHSNPRGFIYQNKDKKNRLMRIDELDKFSDGTLNDIRNPLDDRLKGIRMQYLPPTIWRKGDNDRAAAMIQAIEKMLKTRRIMRSLEKFVDGRLYERDFRMLQRTI